MEQQKLIEFKWNKKDGLMLNIDQKASYRFREKGWDDNGEDKDFRQKKIYPPSKMSRKFSDEENWFDELAQIIDEKVKTLSVGYFQKK